MKETKGENAHKPGENMIKEAFDRLTEEYFGKL